METAVDQRDRQINHRVTERAFLRRLRRRLAHCRNEIAGHRAADDLVDELEALTTWARRHVDLDVGELAVTAGLPLQAPMLMHRLLDGFLERHAWLVRADLQGIGLRQ